MGYTLQTKGIDCQTIKSKNLVYAICKRCILNTKTQIVWKQMGRKRYSKWTITPKKAGGSILMSSKIMSNKINSRLYAQE